MLTWPTKVCGEGPFKKRALGSRNGVVILPAEAGRRRRMTIHTNRVISAMLAHLDQLIRLRASRNGGKTKTRTKRKDLNAVIVSKR